MSRDGFLSTATRTNVHQYGGSLVYDYNFWFIFLWYPRRNMGSTVDVLHYALSISVWYFQEKQNAVI